MIRKAMSLVVVGIGTAAALALMLAMAGLTAILTGTVVYGVSGSMGAAEVTTYAVAATLGLIFSWPVLDWSVRAVRRAAR